MHSDNCKSLDIKASIMNNFKRDNMDTLLWMKIILDGFHLYFLSHVKFLQVSSLLHKYLSL